jgi:DNA primase
MRIRMANNKKYGSDLYTDDQVRRVLEGSGIDIEKELDTDFIIFCPYHNNFRTPAGEVSKTKGTFLCFSCQTTRDLISFISENTNRTYFEAVRFITSKAKNVDITTFVNKALVDVPEYFAFDELIIKRLNHQALNSPRAISYYERRKINKESIIKFNLGYSEKQDMVTVPVHAPDGLAVGFVGRSIEGKEFKNTPKLPKAKVLFNLHRVKTSSKVYIVESSFDAIRLDQVGLPAVATLGANVSNTQIELLQKYFNNIIVIADNDEAGGNMKDRIIERLKSRVSVIQLDKQYKDIGDMQDVDIKKLEDQFDNSIISMLK